MKNNLQDYIYNILGGIIYLIVPNDVHKKILKEQIIRSDVFTPYSVFDESNINNGKTFFYLHKDDLNLIFKNIEGYKNFEFNEYIILKIDLNKYEKIINFSYDKNLYMFNCINSENSIPLYCCTEKNILNYYEDIGKIS